MPVVVLENLHKTYRLSSQVDVHALRGVSLSFEAGEFAAIMGPSGSGKSTLMHVLGCLDRPTRGRYLLDGEDVSELSRDRLAAVRNQKLGFVFQSFNLLSRTSALENVELPLMYGGNLSLREIQRRARAALDRVGLSDRADHHPSQLSGGQQQRVAIARALVTEPTLLVADEPTGNLDTRTGVEIMEIFQDLNERGITLIMVTHEADIGQYARRRIVMRDGRVIQDDPVTERLNATVEKAKLPELLDEEEEETAP
jgi:putative ABC transport system ATP-binding protein